MASWVPVLFQSLLLKESRRERKERGRSLYPFQHRWPCLSTVKYVLWFSPTVHWKYKYKQDSVESFEELIGFFFRGITTARGKRCKKWYHFKRCWTFSWTVTAILASQQWEQNVRSVYRRKKWAPSCRVAVPWLSLHPNCCSGALSVTWDRLWPIAFIVIKHLNSGEQGLAHSGFAGRLEGAWKGKTLVLIAPGNSRWHTLWP